MNLASLVPVFGLGRHRFVIQATAQQVTMTEEETSVEMATHAGPVKSVSAYAIQDLVRFFVILSGPEQLHSAEVNVLLATTKWVRVTRATAGFAFRAPKKIANARRVLRSTPAYRDPLKRAVRALYCRAIMAVGNMYVEGASGSHLAKRPIRPKTEVRLNLRTAVASFFHSPAIFFFMRSSYIPTNQLTQRHRQ